MHNDHSIASISSGVTKPSKGKIGHSTVRSTKSYYSHRERIQKILRLKMLRMMIEIILHLQVIQHNLGGYSHREHCRAPDRITAQISSISICRIRGFLRLSSIAKQ